MDIQVNRLRFRPWGVEGELFVNGIKACDTLEHPTCWQAEGQYPITESTCPFRHGDGAMHCTQGEIVVGDRLMLCVVTQSRLRYNRLMDRVRKVWKRHKTIVLTITKETGV